MASEVIFRLEGAGGGEPRLANGLRLCHSLGASLDHLLERIYWNPGEMAPKGGRRRPPSERLAGFFSVLPANVPAFQSPPGAPVGSRREAASIVGRNVRSARERRHLTQAEVARGAGLSKAGLSLIERGTRETTVETLISLARFLQVPPGSLLAGVAWEAGPPCVARAQRPGRRHGERSLDAAVARAWSEGKTTREIADLLRTSRGSVSAIVHRLRERGEPLAHRRAPTRAVHRDARRRRARCAAADPSREHFPPAPSQVPSAISGREIAACIGTNVRDLRRRLGLTQRQLAEAAELDRSYVNQIERGNHIPSLSILVKLAASLNVRCERIAAGVVWEPQSGSYRPAPIGPETAAPLRRLGENVASRRRRIGISQQALADRAQTNRSEVSALERGSRNRRAFAVIRVAGVLGADAPELFTDLADWYVRPLPAPECAPEDRLPSKSERDDELERLWREGRPEAEIALALGLTRGALAAAVRELRDRGRCLPYRRPPRGKREVAARRRRTGAVGPPVPR